MKIETRSYVLGVHKYVEVGKEYYFGELWDGRNEGSELLESGSVWIGNAEYDMPVVAAFNILEVAGESDISKIDLYALDDCEISEAKVVVTDIY